MPSSRCTARLRRPRLTTSQLHHALIATGEYDIFVDLNFALSLAIELDDGGLAHNEIVVLADENRLVTGIFVDPDPLLGLMPAVLADHFGITAMTGLVVTRALHQITFDECSDDELSTYRLIANTFAEQGIELLDVVFSDGELLRSMDISTGFGHWSTIADAA